MYVFRRKHYDVFTTLIFNPLKTRPDFLLIVKFFLFRDTRKRRGINTHTFTHWLKAKKEERELAFLRKVFQQYKAGYPLERLYPAHVYQSLQERRLINDPPRGETPRHEPLRLLATTGSPAHQRGLSADDGATAGDGVVAAEVFRWADNRRESKTNHLLWRLRNKTYTLLI